MHGSHRSLRRIFHKHSSRPKPHYSTSQIHVHISSTTQNIYIMKWTVQSTQVSDVNWLCFSKVERNWNWSTDWKRTSDVCFLSPPLTLAAAKLRLRRVSLTTRCRGSMSLFWTKASPTRHPCCINTFIRAVICMKNKYGLASFFCVHLVHPMPTLQFCRPSSKTNMKPPHSLFPAKRKD